MSTINQRLSETLARLELMDRVDDDDDDDDEKDGEDVRLSLFFGDDDAAETTMFSAAHDFDGFERESISKNNEDGDGGDNDDEKEDSNLPSCAICLNAPSLGKFLLHGALFALVLRQVHRSMGELPRGGGKRAEEETWVIVYAS